LFARNFRKSKYLLIFEKKLWDNFHQFSRKFKFLSYEDLQGGVHLQYSTIMYWYEKATMDEVMGGGGAGAMKWRELASHGRLTRKLTRNLNACVPQPVIRTYLGWETGLWGTHSEGEGGGGVWLLSPRQNRGENIRDKDKTRGNLTLYTVYARQLFLKENVVESRKNILEDFHACFAVVLFSPFSRPYLLHREKKNCDRGKEDAMIAGGEGVRAK
jgi:hypothetical protein